MKILIVLILISMAIIFVLLFSRGNEQIFIGMNLIEAEQILGPSQHVSKVPVSPTGPILKGNDFYKWGNRFSHPPTQEIFVSVEKGVIIDLKYINLSF